MVVAGPLINQRSALLSVFCRLCNDTARSGLHAVSTRDRARRKSRKIAQLTVNGVVNHSDRRRIDVADLGAVSQVKIDARRAVCALRGCCGHGLQRPAVAETPPGGCLRLRPVGIIHVQPHGVVTLDAIAVRLSDLVSRQVAHDNRPVGKHHQLGKALVQVVRPLVRLGVQPHRRRGIQRRVGRRIVQNLEAPLVALAESHETVHDVPFASPESARRVITVPNHVRQMMRVVPGGLAVPQLGSAAGVLRKVGFGIVALGLRPRAARQLGQSLGSGGNGGPVDRAVRRSDGFRHAARVRRVRAAARPRVARPGFHQHRTRDTAVRRLRHDAARSELGAGVARLGAR